MAQYTDTFTGFGGITTNSVLNSTTNTQTITVTAPTGQVATVTVTPQDVSSNLDNIVSNLSRQLNEQGADVGLRGIVQGVNSTSANVNTQNQEAQAVTQATGNPPPDEKQAIPVQSQDNPNPVPPSQTEQDAQVADPLTTPPGTDEFDGIDTRIAANENALPEPPVVSDEEVQAQLQAINPPEPAPITQESLGSSTRGLTAPLAKTQGQASSQDARNLYAQGDWRVRLQLAPGADYLYKRKDGNVGILQPLIATDGVLFPYTPSISVNYGANYDPTTITHSNYKIFQYQSSVVDGFQISCDFTAQDTFEANYLLAVIHFFRSVTKMFYGQDQNPVNGTPPPLLYLTGMGAFQFDRHPLAITAFNYALPTDVDYIQAGSSATVSGINAGQTGNQTGARFGPGIQAGGTNPAPAFNKTPTGTVDPTYVPTKIQISLSAVPIVSRNDISNNFSLREYGTGNLLRGSKRNGAGIW